MRADKGFDTVEHYAPPDSFGLPGGARYCSLLFEDVGNAAANCLFDAGLSQKATRASFARCVSGLSGRVENLLFVTNDIFADGLEYPEETRRYLDCMASLHRDLARRADVVLEVVCGLPVFHKGQLRLRTECQQAGSNRSAVI